LQQTMVLGKLKLGMGKRFAVGLPAVEKIIKETDDVLSDALTYTRTLVTELSPPVLRNHGLAAGIKWLAEYMKKYEQTVTVNVPENEGLRLPEDQVMLLFQSVRELLINSSKHAGTGEATVIMEQSDGNLSITVSDKGEGFDLAAAAAAAGTPNGGISSKFGFLSIQERMRALGGSFIIQSAPGEGTMATLTLPLSVDVKGKALGVEGEEESGNVREKVRGKTSGVRSGEATSGDASRVIRVLLVDDHAMVRQGLRSVLDAYQDLQMVGEARDGAEAVKLVEELRPRVIVMDINMPKMNGIEATARIKTQWPETIVVGISVNSEDDNSETMKRAGAVTVLTKDRAVDQLHDAIVQEVGVSANISVDNAK
ncbi:MAG TPA: response regulator, partial [Nitrospira sp.]|nr:response regulator [Nitrospira sp.]